MDHKSINKMLIPHKVRINNIHKMLRIMLKILIILNINKSQVNRIIKPIISNHMLLVSTNKTTNMDKPLKMFSKIPNTSKANIVNLIQVRLTKTQPNTINNKTNIKK
jgi:hypothetical protein